MDERGVLHLIEDDLSETWVEDWAGVGVAAIEDYLAKHLAFLDLPRRRRRRSVLTASTPRSSPSARSSAPFGIAPTAEACGSPFSNRIIIGIDETP